MSPLVRIIFLVGIGFIILGCVLYLAERLGLSLGQLPGDFRIQRGNLTCFFPLATTILLSVVLTILINLVIRYFRK